MQSRHIYSPLGDLQADNNAYASTTAAMLLHCLPQANLHFSNDSPELPITHLVVVTGSQTDIDILALTGLHEEP